MRITSQTFAEMSSRIGHFAEVSVGVNVREEYVLFAARTIRNGVAYSADRTYSFAEIRVIVSTCYLIDDFCEYAKKELDAAIPKPWLHQSMREA